MGILVSIFSHTPEEAMSGGLVKACVPSKIDSVEEKLSSLILEIVDVYYTSIIVLWDN